MLDYLEFKDELLPKHLKLKSVLDGKQTELSMKLLEIKKIYEECGKLELKIQSDL